MASRPKEKYIPCPLCGSNKYRTIYKSTLNQDDYNLEVLKKNLKNSLDDYTKHGQVTKCISCGLVYVNPRESISMILKGYAEVIDEEYIQTEKYRKMLLSNHLQKIEKWKKPGKILDVGCFAGFFLELAKKNGWKTYGIEPSIWASDIAKKRGVNIIGKNIEDTTLPENFFETITLWDVIEHLDNPNNVIYKINKSLKKGGIIAIGTPDIESFFAKILGSKCPFLIRMHIVLFSKKTLIRLLTNNNFVVLSVGKYGRIFPLSYILSRIKVKNYLLNTIIKKIISIRILGDITVNLNFGDSIIIVAKKI